MEEILCILRSDGYGYAADRIEDLQKALERAANQINREVELEYIKQFSVENSLDDGICRDQLRSLWTAYCLHHGLAVDTAGYDSDLREVWQAVVEAGHDAADWAEIDRFDYFMCQELV